MLQKTRARKQVQEWIDRRLQAAYDALWDGDAEECDRINEHLPEQQVRAMLDAWLDDQDPKRERGFSKWYYGGKR